MKTWEEFKKFQSYRSGVDANDFYGCVDAEGLWFDSSTDFTTAVHWCCYKVDEFDLTNEGEMKWMETEGRKRGYSIIHGTMIKQMYEKGLIK
jgi:hypothetical protein